MNKENRNFVEWAIENIYGLPFEGALRIYQWLLVNEKKFGEQTIAAMGLIDRFFLFVVLLRRKDGINPWLYERCREHEKDPDDHLDLWAREHYKSSLITFAANIQEILRDPTITILLLSHNESVSKKFLRHIKTEFEENERLKSLYSDVLWKDPKTEAPKWSEKEGICVKRDTNTREQTVEQCGLVDGLPIGSHYKLLNYDDVVTPNSVGTPEMMAKTTDAFRHSLSLGVRRSEGGRRRAIGTRYHNNDTYREAMDDGVFTPRIHAATHNGKEPPPWGDGVPVFRTLEEEQRWRQDQGPWIYGSQQLQNPTVDKIQGFRKEWLRYWPAAKWTGMNIYILCDPASEKKKENDYTVFMVIGLASDQNIYIIDMVRDRFTLTERTDMLFQLHRTYAPVGVGWEKYGKDSDIEHIEYVQREQNYRFHVQGLAGGQQKPDRIKKLVPKFEQGKIYLPERCIYVNYLNESRNLTKDFVDQEYLEFPMPQHDDMLDCLSRILDPKFSTSFPKRVGSAKDGYIDPKIVQLIQGGRRKRSFMTA